MLVLIKLNNNFCHIHSVVTADSGLIFILLAALSTILLYCVVSLFSKFVSKDYRNALSTYNKGELLIVFYYFCITCRYCSIAPLATLFQSYLSDKLRALLPNSGNLSISLNIARKAPAILSLSAEATQPALY